LFGIGVASYAAKIYSIAPILFGLALHRRCRQLAYHHIEPRLRPTFLRAEIYDKLKFSLGVAVLEVVKLGQSRGAAIVCRKAVYRFWLGGTAR